jgi:hypothetical protein
MTPFEVKTSRPSYGVSHRSSDVGFDVVVGNLNQNKEK